jgi:hypothetical protein
MGQRRANDPPPPTTLFAATTFLPQRRDGLFFIVPVQRYEEENKLYGVAGKRNSHPECVFGAADFARVAKESDPKRQHRLERD